VRPTTDAIVSEIKKKNPNPLTRRAGDVLKIGG
jgi:hypothetical protein